MREQIDSVVVDALHKELPNKSTVANTEYTSPILKSKVVLDTNTVSKV